jgi:hypothetical protein
MTKETKEMKNCHNCGAEKSVELKKKETRSSVSYNVGKCAVCKKQNTFKALIAYNTPVSVKNTERYG